VAHELGHLLLGAYSHSNRGVMGARWSGTDLLLAGQRGLSFSASEEKLLRTVLTARSQAAVSWDDNLE
jgi:hypothetical protein